VGWAAGGGGALWAPRARTIGDLDALVAAVEAEARPGDRILVMSNGGFGGVHERLLAALG
jgi:UDP-N-acetylmuramate: L-alanyl-gamma-D-glutamyl-meso-diaminopimelate ligase